MNVRTGINVTGLEKILRHAYAASGEGRYAPVMIWGEAGIGKSQTVARVAQDLGIGFKDLRLGLFEAPDLLGVFRQQEVYPCFLDFEEGRSRAARGRLFTRYGLYAHIVAHHPDVLEHEHVPSDPDDVVEWAIEQAAHRGLSSLFSIRTMNSPPSWLPPPDSEGILLLDELNRAPRDVRQGVFQIVLDRMVGQIPLPPRWIIVSANNPPDAQGSGVGYQVSQTEDRAFLGRFCHLAVEPTLREWLSWARRAGVNPLVRAFIAEKGPEYLGIDIATRLPDLDPMPRAWVMLSNLTRPIPPEVQGGIPQTLSEDMLASVATGLVGVHAARSWFAYRMIREPLVTAEALVNDFVGSVDRLKKYLHYPLYDPVTGESIKDEDGTEILCRRSDLILVAYDSINTALQEAKTNKALQQSPMLLAAALGLIKLGLTSESDGGLGLRDVSAQYLKQWVGSSNYVIDPGIVTGRAKIPGLLEALAVVGLAQADLMTMIREMAALTGRPK